MTHLEPNKMIEFFKTVILFLNYILVSIWEKEKHKYYIRGLYLHRNIYKIHMISATQ